MCVTFFGLLSCLHWCAVKYLKCSFTCVVSVSPVAVNLGEFALDVFNFPWTRSTLYLIIYAIWLPGLLQGNRAGSYMNPILSVSLLAIYCCVCLCIYCINIYIDIF